MRAKLKKSLSLLLALVLCLGCMSFGAFAEGEETTASVSTFEEFQNALSNNNINTISLTGDINMTSGLTISRGVTIESAIESESDSVKIIYGPASGYGFTIEQGAEVSFTDVKYTGSKETSSRAAFNVYGGTLNLTRVTVSNGSHSLTVNGKAPTPSVVNIIGGTYNSGQTGHWKYAINIDGGTEPGKAVLNVNSYSYVAPTTGRTVTKTPLIYGIVMGDTAGTYNTLNMNCKGVYDVAIYPNSYNTVTGTGTAIASSTLYEYFDEKELDAAVEKSEVPGVYTIYSSLQEAIDAAEAGDNVRLMRDITVTDENLGKNDAAFTINKDIRLLGLSHTIHANYSHEWSTQAHVLNIVGSAHVRVAGLKIVGNATADNQVIKGGINITGTAPEVTLGTGNAIEGVGASVIVGANATATIETGTYKNGTWKADSASTDEEKNLEYAINVDKGGKLTVTGGTIGRILVGDSDGYTNTLSVSAGSGSIERIIKSANGTNNVSVTGGKFTSDPSAYIAAGYKVNESNGTYAVVPKGNAPTVSDTAVTAPVESSDPVDNNNGTQTTSAAVAMPASKINKSKALTFTATSSESSTTAPKATVTFDSTAASKIKTNANGSDVTLNVDVTEPTAGSTSNVVTVEVTLTDKDGNNLYAQTAANGDKAAAGTATITVPYVVADGNVPVITLVDGETRTVVSDANATYNSADQTVAFTVAHFTEYEVGQEAETTPTDRAGYLTFAQGWSKDTFYIDLTFAVKSEDVYWAVTSHGGRETKTQLSELVSVGETSTGYKKYTISQPVYAYDMNVPVIFKLLDQSGNELQVSFGSSGEMNSSLEYGFIPYLNSILNDSNQSSYWTVCEKILEYGRAAISTWATTYNVLYDQNGSLISA